MALDPISQANLANDTNITANARGQITGPVLHSVIGATIGAVSTIAVGIGYFAPNGTFALNPGSIPPAQEIAMAGAVTIPNVPNLLVDAAPGSTLTLPAGAIVGTRISVKDSADGAAASPIAILPSSDAPIAEQSPFPLIVNGQEQGFRKSAAGPWQPY